MKRAALCLALAAVLAGCEALLIDPQLEPAIEVPILLADGDALSPAWIAIIGAVDNVRIRVARPDGVARDTVLAVRPENGTIRTRLTLAPNELTSGLVVSAVLRDESHDMFTGQTVIDATSASAATVSMEPILDRIMPGSLPNSLTALGQSVPLAGVVVLANGDTVPGARPTWTSLTPAVVEVTPNGIAIARSNGVAALNARFGQLSQTFTVTVRQVAVQITGILPSNPTVAVGDVLVFSVTGRDANGNALQPGAAATWRVDNPAVLTLDAAGNARARRGGSAVVSATILSQTNAVSTRVTVVTPPLPPATLLWSRSGVGIVIGDLTESYQALGTAPSATEPAWSPDRSAIAFVQGRELRVRTLAGTERRLEATVTVWSPQWSTDGWIYFGGTSDGDRIYRIRPDGTGQESLFGWRSNESVPRPSVSPSPDGRAVTWGDRPSFGTSRLLVQELGAAAPRTVTAGGSIIHSARWSPDGQWIAFIEGNTLSVIRPDGSSKRSFPGEALSPGLTWSPDSAWLLGYAPEVGAVLLEVASARMIGLPWAGGYTTFSWR